MSAFVVTQDHIAALVNAAELHARLGRSAFRWTHDETRYELVNYGADEEYDQETPWGTTHHSRITLQTLGQMLLDTCLRSVFARYPDCLTVADLPGYPPDLEGRGAAYHHNAMLYVRPLAALKAIDCYEYQSCEFSEWPESCAAAFCTALRGALIVDLPGYDDAPWEIVAGEQAMQAVRM